MLLPFEPGAIFEAGVAGGRHDHGAGPDQMVAGLADRRLAAGEAVDVVGQRQREVDAMHHRIGAVPVQPADELDGAQDRELVATRPCSSNTRRS